jgi:hypothetical protein
MEDKDNTVVTEESATTKTELTCQYCGGGYGSGIKTATQSCLEMEDCDNNFYGLDYSTL